jgi:metal-responsive CopG/Arc/MetJ family transcriptional regulator
MDDAAMNTDQVAVALPANMLAQIDAQVGSGFVDRQEFIRAAVRHYLEYMQAANNRGAGQLFG